MHLVGWLSAVQGFALAQNNFYTLTPQFQKFFPVQLLAHVVVDCHF